MLRTVIRYATFGLAAGLGGCTAVIPHTFHTPLVRARGEAEVSLNTGLHGTGGQAAYALTDHLTLLGSYQQRVRASRGFWARTGELGAGRTWATSPFGAWSLYGGLGYGAGKSIPAPCLDLCGDANYDRVGYTTAFVQPTYRWQPVPEAGFSVGVKVVAYRFHRYDTVTEYGRGFFPPDSTSPTGTAVVSRPGYVGWGFQPGANVYRNLGRHFRLTMSTSLLIPTPRSFPTLQPFAVGGSIQYYFGGRPAGK